MNENDWTELNWTDGLGWPNDRRLNRYLNSKARQTAFLDNILHLHLHPLQWADVAAVAAMVARVRFPVCSFGTFHIGLQPNLASFVARGVKDTHKHRTYTLTSIRWAYRPGNCVIVLAVLPGQMCCNDFKKLLTCVVIAAICCTTADSWSPPSTSTSTIRRHRSAIAFRGSKATGDGDLSTTWHNCTTFVTLASTGWTSNRRQALVSLEIYAKVETPPICVACSDSYSFLSSHVPSLIWKLVCEAQQLYICKRVEQTHTGEWARKNQHNNISALAKNYSKVVQLQMPNHLYTHYSYSKNKIF